MNHLELLQIENKRLAVENSNLEENLTRKCEIIAQLQGLIIGSGDEKLIANMVKVIADIEG